MAYLQNLDWMTALSSFSEDEKKVLLVLSHDKYRWRTRERIIAVSGLSPRIVDNALSALIEKRYVRIGKSRSSKNIIFGLIERVGATA